MPAVRRDHVPHPETAVAQDSRGQQALSVRSVQCDLFEVDGDEVWRCADGWAET